MGPVKVGIVHKYHQHHAQDVISITAITDVGVDAGITCLTGKNNPHDHQAKNDDRNKRVHDLADHMFIFGITLLNFGSPDSPILPHIKNQVKRSGK
jgi:hypothetical protein